MIYFVTSRKELYADHKFKDYDDIKCIDDPAHFTLWSEGEEMIQLDTETNIVENGAMQHEERELYVIQFGSIDRKIQYVIDIVDLSAAWMSAIKLCLTSNKSFISHNAKFEYLVIRSNLDVTLEDMHDTYLMSRIANTGLDLPTGYHSLAGCLSRFFDIELDKGSQTSFTGDPLTMEQIAYAASDVIDLHKLYIKLKEILDSWNLYNLYDRVERQVMKTYADMELTPMRIDMDYWEKLAQSFIEEAKDIKEDLDILVAKDPKLVKELKTCKNVLGTNLIQPQDEYKMNWASITFKRDVFKVLAPNLPADVKTKPQLKKFLKEKGSSIPFEQSAALNLYMSRSYDKLNDMLINDHNDFLENNGYFISKDTILINWASPVQRLFVFQFYYPKLEDTNSKSLIRIKKNSLITKFKDWTGANKNVTSYGKGFAKKYVKTDSTIAPFGLNQILATGRVSFGILLQMPAKTNKFRNAFLPPGKDDVFVDTDYSSMEVLIAAQAAGETAFLTAIKKDKDLHSMSASLLFKDKWKKLAEPDCEHLKTGKRCKCKAHDTFRNFSKAVTFGLFYGIGAHGLSDRLDISKTEAQDIVDRFFRAFPNFKAMFEANEKYAIRNNHIVGLAPIGRIRFFFHPSNSGEEGTIGRAAKNFPCYSWTDFNYNTIDKKRLTGELKSREFEGSPMG